MDFFSSLLQPSTMVDSLRIDEIVISFTLSFFLSTLLGLIYIKTNRGNPKRFIMAQSLALLSLTIVAAMSIIGNSIARAFGLIGAVSIVRFRTTVETSKDMTYILLSIIIGLACGIQFWMLAGVFTVCICLAILLGEWVLSRAKIAERQTFRFRLLLPQQMNYDAVRDVFTAYNVHVKLLTVSMKRKYTLLTFSLSVNRNFNMTAMIGDLQASLNKKKRSLDEAVVIEEDVSVL